jgi:hypothetical protein
MFSHIFCIPEHKATQAVTLFQQLTSDIPLEYITPPPSEIKFIATPLPERDQQIVYDKFKERLIRCRHGS